MNELAQRKCVPCEEGTVPLNSAQINLMIPELSAGWRLVERHRLEREFTFPDFRQALEFTNKLGNLAEAEGHHPDIQLSWGKVVVSLWTHKVAGLTENDFVMAAKIDRLE